MATINAFVLYKEIPGLQKQTLKEFLQNDISHLLTSHNSLKRFSQKNTPDICRLTIKHFLSKIDTPFQCAVWPIRKRTFGVEDLVAGINT